MKRIIRVTRYVQEQIDVEVDIPESGTDEESRFQDQCKAEEEAKDIASEIPLDEWEINVTDCAAVMIEPKEQ